MNPIQILNQNELGCVMSCSANNDIHLGFGMVIYVLSHCEFENFSRSINNLYEKHYSDMMLNGKKVFFNTDSEKIVLAFNTDELKSIWLLVNEALIMLEVNNVLKVLN